MGTRVSGDVAVLVMSPCAGKLQLGRSYSVASFGRLGNSSLSTFGRTVVGQSLSVVESLSRGSSVSIASFTRLGSSVSTSSSGIFGSSVSVLVIIIFGSSEETRGLFGFIFSVGDWHLPIPLDFLF
jgi:hypothetical protein